MERDKSRVVSAAMLLNQDKRSKTTKHHGDEPNVLAQEIDGQKRRE